VNSIIITLYLSVNCDYGQITQTLVGILLASIMFSDLVPIPLVGICASGLSILSSINTLKQVPLVVQSRNSAFINFPFAFGGLIHFCVWTLYGLLQCNIIFTVSQFTGVVCYCINVLFFVWASTDPI
jgi:uncharacterized protein with PQ loop repeat